MPCYKPTVAIHAAHLPVDINAAQSTGYVKCLAALLQKN